MRHLIIVGALALLTTPLLTYAADVDYARVTERNDTEVLVKRNTLTSEGWYRCTVSTLECAALSAGATLGNPPAPEFMAAYRSLMPAGASSLTRSPDGRYIAFYIPATQSRGQRTWGVMDTTDLSIRTKVESVSYWDLLTEGIRYYSFSPDSQTLVYINDIKNHPTLYKVDLSALPTTNNTLPTTKMFSKEYTVADVIFTDNDTILFTANRGGPYSWSMYQYTLSTGALKTLAGNVSFDASLRLYQNKVLFGEADANGVRPAVYNLATNSVEHFALPAVATLASPAVPVKSLKHGLGGVFMIEPSRASDTLLVWLHGGPYRQTSAGYHPYFSYGAYDWVLEVARRSDVGVLKIDYPGSAGFGRSYAESITRKVGVKDATETAAAVADFAKRNGYKNVYLMGNSYGGYLAMKMLVDKPTAYKGAASIGGVADWTTMLTALDNSIFNVQFGGTVGDTNANYDLYNAASIYNRVANLSGQKIVLVHGSKDMTIPYRQAEGLATFLATQSIPHSLVTMSGEDHVFKKPESFELLCTSVLQMVGRASTGCDL